MTKSRQLGRSEYIRDFVCEREQRAYTSYFKISLQIRMYKTHVHLATAATAVIAYCNGAACVQFSHSYTLCLSCFSGTKNQKRGKKTDPNRM